MIKSKSIIYILNYTSKNIKCKIYDAIERLPELPSSLSNYCTRFTNVYTNFDRNDITRIKQNIIAQVNNNIKNKSINGFVTSVVVYFIVDNYKDKQDLMFNNNDFFDLVGENFHWITVNTKTKEFDFSTLLIYNKRYIEKAYEINSNVSSYINEDVLNNLKKNELSLVKYYTDALKVINLKRYITNDLVYKETKCPKTLDTNDILKKSFYNLSELEYYEKFTIYVAEYYSLREKYVKTNDQELYDMLDKKNVLIQKIKNEIYFSKTDVIYSKDNLTCVINTNNKFIEVSKNQGVLSYVESKKLNSNVIIMNNNIYYIDFKLRNSLSERNVKSRVNNLVLSDVEWIDTNDEDKILVFKLSKYNLNELEIAIYDVKTKNLQQIKTKNKSKLLRNYLTTGKNGKKLEVYNERISSNIRKISNKYITKFDKINKKWLILNHIGSSNLVDIFRMIVLSNDGKCICDKKIELDKIYFTGNTKILYSNGMLYIPRNNYLSQYDMKDEELKERRIENRLISNNSRLELSPDKELLLFEGKGIYKVNLESFK